MSVLEKFMSHLERDVAAPSEENTFKLYHYDPTIAGGVIFVLLFLATTVLHFWQLFRIRCWILIPLALGGIFQIIGYAARCVSGKESPDWTLGPYIVQAILLLVAPALYAATVYMALGKIVMMVSGEHLIFIPLRWKTKIFVTGDVLSFVLQGGGGGYQASGSLEAMDLGANIIIAGLFVQLLFFGAFMTIAVHFDFKLRHTPTSRSHAVPWKKHIYALYVGSILIMVRSIFRAAEYLQGNSGELLMHEAYLYIFDALLMFLVMVLFNWIHPGEVQQILQGRAAVGSWKMASIPGSQERLGSLA